MNKRWVLLALVLAVALVVRRLVSRTGGAGWGGMIERMPDSAPPKWMFNNITAIRENTDEILERLKTAPASSGVGAHESVGPD